MEKVLILVIDGCAPEYFTEKTAPHIFRLAKKTGFAKRILCAVPSVTNVNHACILSGKWPEETGVVGNYFYNPETGRGISRGGDLVHIVVHRLALVVFEV